MDRLVRVAACAGASALFALLAVMAVVLVDAATPALRILRLDASWDQAGTLGSAVLPSLVGTAFSAGLALVVAVPLALGVALFVTEFAPEAASRRAAIVLEVMGAIPTLVFGMWGLVVLLPWLGSTTVEAGGVGALVTAGGGVVPAGLVLAAMLVPSLSNNARKMIAAVPTSLREAAIAVGATRWEVVRHVVLPHVRSGLAGAVILGLGRSVGEAMAVVLIIGNRPFVPSSVPSTTMATELLTGLRPNLPELHASSLALLALCLLIITVVVRGVGRRLVRLSSTPGGAA